MSATDLTATAAKQPLTQGAEQERQSFHDFRDRDGKPDEKRDAGSWSDWQNRPDGYQPGGRK